MYHATAGRAEPSRPRVHRSCPDTAAFDCDRLRDEHRVTSRCLEVTGRGLTLSNLGVSSNRLTISRPERFVLRSVTRSSGFLPCSSTSKLVTKPDGM